MSAAQPRAGRRAGPRFRWQFWQKEMNAQPDARVTVEGCHCPGLEEETCSAPSPGKTSMCQMAGQGSPHACRGSVASSAESSGCLSGPCVPQWGVWLGTRGLAGQAGCLCLFVPGCRSGLEVSVLT